MAIGGRQIMRMVTKRLRDLRECARGGMLVSAALSLPIVFAALGIASDFAMMYKTRSQLQAAADAAALAAAHEIPLAKSNPEQIINAAKLYAGYQLHERTRADKPDGKPDGDMSDLLTEQPDQDGGEDTGADARLEIDAEVLEGKSAVVVTVTEHWTPFFAHFVSTGVTPIQVQATARFVGTGNVCVLGLSPDGVSGVVLRNSAQLTANNCGVYSNTNEKNGLLVANDAVLQSALNCVAGGYSIANSKAVTPEPLTDCPPIPDPLASRPAPEAKGCDHDSLAIDGGAMTLAPGVYCGGLSITGKSEVTFFPGTYVISGGPLEILGMSSATGDGVGFYLTGADSNLNVSPETHIAFSAPTDGPMAGLLFFEDRDAPGERRHRISSNDARKLIGTIYLPLGTLTIDANKPMADESAYTAIVVQNLVLMSGPQLVLNTDYGATDVPVPDGLAGSKQIVLSD